ncbi:molybdate ABC transporter permease subunit, partial [Acinetobacter baumannii]
LPLVLPPVVPGYLLLQVFGSRGIIGKYLAPLGINFAFNWKGAVLASAVLGFPLLVQSIRLAMVLGVPGFEMAAVSLGAAACVALF